MGNSRAVTLTACVNNPHSSAIKGDRGSLNVCNMQTGLQSQCFLWMQRQTHTSSQSVSKNINNAQTQISSAYMSGVFSFCFIHFLFLVPWVFWLEIMMFKMEKKTEKTSQMKASVKKAHGRKRAEGVGRVKIWEVLTRGEREGAETHAEPRGRWELP